MKRTFLLAACLSLATTTASAAEPHEVQLRGLVDKELKSLLAESVVVDAVNAQNARHAAITEQEILALDKQWRAETSEGSGPLIAKVLAKALSRHLGGYKNSKQGLVTEIFVMDNKGLNVGQSDVTSDYWQGDEAKWKSTYLAGPGAIHIGEVELDESSQTYQVQVSLSVMDGDKVIGAATFGVDVEQLDL